MAENRIIERVSLEDLDSVDTFFSRLSGIDPENVEARYGTGVQDAKELVREKCSIGMTYERVPIASRNEKSVVLSTGQVLEGKIIPRVLEEANELYAFVIALDGLQDVSSDDMMIEYFADTWASAYTECAQATFASKVSDELAGEGSKRTHLWCPGQHAFELSNQLPLFDLLKPEDIGCTLTSRLMMVPVKACSGITGVVSQDTEVTLKPCDFCTFKKTCPASKSGCAAL